tara:strand:- start:62 stop:598 length:537 start_codon:yes stop_codon:yes gene_type:complete
MALWGSNDNLVSSGTVSLNYTTKVVTGSGTTFGTVGFGVTGDVIRFGIKGGGGTYYGDAVIVSTASTTSLTIGSTDGISGAAIAGTSYYLSELPKSSVLDSSYSETQTGYDKNVYGISTTTAYAGVSTKYRTNGTGWVGVTTYTDVHGNLRVKSEILVAASGITTGSNGIAYPTSESA